MLAGHRNHILASPKKQNFGDCLLDLHSQLDVPSKFGIEDLKHRRLHALQFAFKKMWNMNCYWPFSELMKHLDTIDKQQEQFGRDRKKFSFCQLVSRKCRLVELRSCSTCTEFRCSNHPYVGQRSVRKLSPKGRVEGKTRYSLFGTNCVP